MLSMHYRSMSHQLIVQIKMLISRMCLTRMMQQVKMLLKNGAKCELCTKPKNVIASRPVKIDEKTTEHSEHVLLYPVGNSLMDKLLAKARD